jgi:hypothetical protein
MIEYSESGGKLTLKVYVVPRASRSEIVGEHNGALRVRIAAPPNEGAANEELVRTLAHAFSVARGAIEIKAGHASRNKKVSIAGLRPDALSMWQGPGA